MAEIKTRDLKTEALVLKRMNYGETDRILTLITPEGKKSVLAKGVRKERSKLAGSVEMFCRSEVVIHQGKGDLAILIAAKMCDFYKNILSDLGRLEVASELLKRTAKVAETTDLPENYEILRQALEALNDTADLDTVLAWFYFNVARAGGEQVNLFFDTDGEKLEETVRYTWDSTEKTLRKSPKGKIGANEIKMMRLILSAKLNLILRVKDAEKMMTELLYIAKTLNQL